MRVDDRAFRSFVAARGPGLQRSAYLMTGDWQLAEDLAQSTLADAYVHWRRVASADNPTAYVHRMLTNNVRSLWRRQSHHERPMADVGQQGAVHDHADEIVRRDELAAALLDLPPRRRRGRPATCRGAQRDRDRRGHGHLGRNGQEPDRTRAGHPAIGSAREDDVVTTDQALLERLAALRPQPPATIDAETVIRVGSRRRRRRRLRTAGAFVPMLGGVLVVALVAISHPAGSAARITAAPPQPTVPPPALAAPDADTVVYFSPYDWFERAAPTTEPPVDKAEAIARYEKYRAELSPGLRTAPVTAVLGIYHRVDPRESTDGTELPGTALTAVLAWAVVQGPADVVDPLGAADGVRICFSATAIDATTGQVPDGLGITIEQNCGLGVRNPVIAPGHGTAADVGGWGTLHAVAVPAATTGSAGRGSGESS